MSKVTQLTREAEAETDLASETALAHGLTYPGGPEAALSGQVLACDVSCEGTGRDDHEVTWDHSQPSPCHSTLSRGEP